MPGPLDSPVTAIETRRANGVILRITGDAATQLWRYMTFSSNLAAQYGHPYNGPKMTPAPPIPADADHAPSLEDEGAPDGQ